MKRSNRRRGRAVALASVVEWTGAMKFEGRLEGRALAPRPPRIHTSFAVLVRCEAGEFPATMTNLSANGFRLSSSRPLECGCEVSIEVPKLPPVSCVIRWADGKEAGGAFLEPIAL